MRTMSIAITPSRIGQSMRLTATITEPHRGTRGVRQVPYRTITRTLAAPYVDEPTPKMLAALVEAVTLVVAGYYEDVELPFDTV